MGRSVHYQLFGLAFIRGDEAAERHELELAAGKPDEPIMLWSHATLGSLAQKNRALLM
jgi:hypothetical protein